MFYIRIKRLLYQNLGKIDICKNYTRKETEQQARLDVKTPYAHLVAKCVKKGAIGTPFDARGQQERVIRLADQQRRDAYQPGRHSF